MASEDELIKVTFERFDFKTLQGLTLFHSAKKQSTESVFGKKGRLVLWYSEETILQLSEIIKLNGGMIHP